MSTEQNLYYGANGLIKKVTDENAVYAKKSWNGRYFDYYIRHATTGPDAPHLLNPWGMHFEQGIDDKRMTSIIGKRRYEFKKVTQQVFDSYVMFLETRNERHYRFAERAQD